MKPLVRRRFGVDLPPGPRGTAAAGRAMAREFVIEGPGGAGRGCSRATHASTAVWASTREVNGPDWSRNGAASCRGTSRSSRSGSARTGSVSRCLMPFLRQIRSNITSPRPLLPSEPVGELLLIVPDCTSSGTPKRASASAKATQTARAVARSTTFAITQNREWSSTPETISASRTTPVVDVVSTSPQPTDDVDLPQLHRPRPLEPHERVLRPLPRPRLRQPVPQQRGDVQPRVAEADHCRASTGEQLSHVTRHRTSIYRVNCR